MLIFIYFFLCLIYSGSYDFFIFILFSLSANTVHGISLIFVKVIQDFSFDVSLIYNAEFHVKFDLELENRCFVIRSSLF